MGFLDSLTADRRKLLAVVLLIQLFVGFVRFYHIQWSYSNNGIDEGIMIERSRLVGEGYALYSELPCDQAPLAFYLGAPFGGDVVSLRALSASLSILAVAAIMLAARRIKGDYAMLAAGLLLAIDFTFLRESRLFSLDGMSADFLAFSLLAFIIYIQKSSRMALIGSGLLIGMSAATKLYGVLGLLGMIVFVVIEARKDKGWAKGKAVDLVLVLVSSAIPLSVFLAYLGPSQMIEGMVLNQGQRSLELWLKGSLLAYFGLNLIYLVPLVYARRTWRIGREARFLLCTSFVILAFMVFQPLVFVHHLALMSPPLAALAGVYVADLLGRKKEIPQRESSSEHRKKSVPLWKVSAAILLITILLSTGLSGYGLARQEEPPQVSIAEDLRGMTAPDDWVISGDPLIGAYADRNIPPEVVNVAYRQYPDLTLEDIEHAIDQYNVTVVIVCWRLAKIDGLVPMLREHNFTEIFPESDPAWGSRWQAYHAALDFFQDDFGPVSVYWRGMES